MSDLRSAVPRCSQQRVLATGERGWRAIASVWPGEPTAARDRAFAACWTLPDMFGDLVPLAAGHGLCTVSSVYGMDILYGAPSLSVFSCEAIRGSMLKMIAAGLPWSDCDLTR